MRKSILDTGDRFQQCPRHIGSTSVFGVGSPPYPEGLRGGSPPGTKINIKYQRPFSVVCEGNRKYQRFGGAATPQPGGSEGRQPPMGESQY